jgi:valine--pyruvate aminotransferase
MSWSTFGERFTRRTGALELMDDLGRAMGGEHTDALMLGGGNPGRIPAVQDAFRARLAEISQDPAAFDRMLGNYAPPRGEIHFRRALARLLRNEYGWPLTADNICLSAGSQAAFFLLFNLLGGEHGDGSLRRILLPMTPEYIGYSDVGLSEGLFTSRRPSIEHLDDRLFKYHVDFAALEPGDDVAAICVSRPTNPTGNVLTDTELARLDELARQRDIPLIVDSAYGLPFPSIVFTEASPIWNDNIILCMSLSKLGLPGLRTGIVVAREEIISALASVTAILNLSVPSVGAVLLQDMVDSGAIIRLSRDVIRPFYQAKAESAANWLKQAMAGYPCHIHRPEGAMFLWVWFPGLPVTSAELYLRLKDAGVLVVPGHHFFPGLEATDWPHRNECLRVTFSQPDAAVQAGIQVIAAQVKRIFDQATSR